MTTTRRTRALLDRPSDVADQREAAERRRAMRALLGTPMLHATGPQDREQIAEDLLLVRRHREAITAEFASGLRYRLIVEPAGARLVKTALGRDSSRPLRRPAKNGVTGRAFSPRGYALLMVTLAVLMRARAQFLLAELVGEIRSAAVDVDITLDLDSGADRRTMHAVLLVLIEYGVLTERDGDIEHWAENNAQSLLDVSMERLGLLLAVPMPTGRTLEQILHPAPLSSAAGGARITTRRLLTESPILTTEELDPDHQEWWARTRHQQVDWFDRVLGLQLELRAEGAVAVDPDEELTDEAFPGLGTVRHAALLILDQVVCDVRKRSRETVGRVSAWWPVTAGALAEAAGTVMSKHSSAFSRDYREKPDALREEATDLLCRMGLLRTANDDWLLHAASGRYAVSVQKASAAGPAVAAENSLFDAPDEWVNRS